jgi:hypothetical protein
MVREEETEEIYKKNSTEKKSGKKVTLAGIVALIFCPCHLFLLLPLLGGTVLGSVLAQYTGILTIVLSVIFGISLWYIIKYIFSNEDGNKAT